MSGISVQAGIRPWSRRWVARLTVVAVSTAVVVPMVGQSAAWATTTEPITPNGASVNVNVPTAGANNEFDLTFTASAGQVVSVKTSSGTFSNNCDVTLSLADPDNANVVAPVCGGSAGFLDATGLDDSGVYFIRVAPSATATGSVNVNLYQFTHQTATMTSGTGVHASLTTPGQNLVGTYAGTAGQKVSVNVTGGTVAGCSESIVLVAPDATVLVLNNVCSGTGFIDATTLPVTGNYQIVLDPQGPVTDTGAIVTAFNVAHQTATMTSGTGVHASLTTPGQNLVGTYAGTAGQKVSVTVTGGTVGGCSENIVLVAPDATVLVLNNVCSGTGSIPVTTLPVTGNYQIVLDPQGPVTDTGATVTLNLAAQDTATAAPVAVLANGTNSSAIVLTIRSTTGTPLSGHTVALAGTGSVKITPASGISNVSGQVSFAATDTAAETVSFTATDQTTGLVAANPVVVFSGAAPQAPAMTAGTGSGVSLTVSGQVFAGTFAGTVGQTVSADLPNPSFTNCFTVALAGPDGSAVNSVHSCGGDAFIQPTRLPFTGTYTVEVLPDGPGTGTGTLTYYSITNQTPALTAGTGAAVNLTTPGQRFLGTFSGTAGQTASADLPNPSFTGCFTFALADPNGTTINSVRSCGNDAFIPPTHLPFTGTYTVEVLPDGSGTGTGTVTYYSITNQSAALVLNNKKSVAVNLTTPGQAFTGTFAGTAGKEISVSVTAATFTQCFTLFLKDANQLTIALTRSCGASASLSFVGLASTGTYTIGVIVDRDGTGKATLGSFTGLAISTTPATPELNVHYSQTLKALPGTSPFKFTLTGGALPTGLTLTAGKITGTPTALGPFTYTLTVTDAMSQTSSTTFTSTVVNELLITNTSLPNGTVNTAYNATLTGTGGKTPYSWSLKGTLPAGLVLNKATGAITGTPTASGTTNFTVVLKDKSSPAVSETKALSITIN